VIGVGKGAGEGGADGIHLEQVPCRLKGS
jgi:hypothetical protein